MNTPANMRGAPLLEQAVNTLRRARRLPPGPYRNDLRQFAAALLKLHRFGTKGHPAIIETKRIALQA
jgi:hypothetical protein